MEVTFSSVLRFRIFVYQRPSFAGGTGGGMCGAGVGPPRPRALVPRQLTLRRARVFRWVVTLLLMPTRAYQAGRRASVGVHSYSDNLQERRRETSRENY